MNEIKLKVSFKKRTTIATGVDLTSGDYNSTKIKFTFDRQDGQKVFEMNNPVGELVYLNTIENNELILVGKTDVTTVHNEKTYVEYLDSNDNIYWYSETDEKLFTDEWVEVAEFDLDNYTKQTKDCSLFSMAGTYPYEISLYAGDSKLTSASGKLKVRAEQVEVGGEVVESYLPLFDELMTTVTSALDDMEEAIDEAENLDIDIETEADETKVIITRRDGTTKEATVSGGGGVSDVQVNSTSVVTDGVANIDLTGKQDTLVSGTNIKTINGQDITGSGNITIESGTGDVADVYYDDESVLDSDKIAQLYSEIYVGDTAPTKSQKIWIDTTEEDVALKDLQDDTTHRLVTDTEKTTWSGKQDALVSGTNIKTINNQSLLGSGNITIQGGGGGTATDVQINGTSIVSDNVANIITNTAYNASSNKIATMSDVPDISGKQDVIDSSHKLSADLISDGTTNKTVTATEKTTWSGKQDALVSGTNIKTINNTSILGSGNIDTEVIQYSTMPTADATWADRIIQYVGDTDYQYTQGFFYYCATYPSEFGDTYGWTNAYVFDTSLIDHPIKFVNYNAFFMYSTIASTFDNMSSDYSTIYICNYNGKKYIASKLITGSPNTIIFTSLGATTNDIVTLDSNNTWGNSTKELQEQLVSGTNIKTINNQSILGSGNITISGGGGSSAWGSITGNLSDQTDLTTALSGKADKSIYGDTVISLGRNTQVGTGSYSSAMGNNVGAYGNYSHAEGSETYTAGESSHAEGLKTTANGKYSHSEGNHTIANRQSQHVFGEYNVRDTGGSYNSRGTYIEVVGNGTSATYTMTFTGDGETASFSFRNQDPYPDEILSVTYSDGEDYTYTRDDYVLIFTPALANGTVATVSYSVESRSNARTLDWSGNEILAGSLTINGNQTVATMSDIPAAIQYSTMPTASATNLGQIVQYTGTTTTSSPIYTNGYFYKCVSDGESTPTYSWSNIGLGSYDKLDDRPKINSITISGNKTAQMYGLQPAGNYATDTSITSVTQATFSREPANNTEYRCTVEMTSITYTMPSSPANNFITWLVFNSGSTATSFNYPNTVLWTGDDVSNNVFTPVADKTYNCVIWWDGTNFNGVSRGV